MAKKTKIEKLIGALIEEVAKEIEAGNYQLSSPVCGNEYDFIYIQIPNLQEKFVIYNDGMNTIFNTWDVIPNEDALAIYESLKPLDNERWEQKQQAKQEGGAA